MTAPKSKKESIRPAKNGKGKMPISLQRVVKVAFAIRSM